MLGDKDRMTVKVKVQQFIIFVVLLTYLKLFNVSLIPTLNALYFIAKILATLLLLIYMLKKKIVLTKASKWCLAFVCWWTLAIIANGNIKNNIQTLLSILGVLFLFNVMRKKPNGLDSILKYLSYISKIYILLQFYTILVDHPVLAESVVSYDKYFLGSDNYSAFILIPLSGFILSNKLINNQKIQIWDYFFFFIGFLCLLIPKSWAGIFAYSAFILLFTFRKSLLLKKVATLRNVFLCNIFLLILVIGFNFQTHFEQIFNAFGKVGMNSREIIWPKAIYAILKRPFLGYGVLTDNQVTSYILYGTTHTHNIILEFLMDSGIIGSFFAFMWFKTAVSVKKGLLKNDTINELLYCIVAYLLCATLDFYIALIYFWILIILFDCIKNTTHEINARKKKYE